MAAAARACVCVKIADWAIASGARVEWKWDKAVGIWRAKKEELERIGGWERALHASAALRTFVGGARRYAAGRARKDRDGRERKSQRELSGGKNVLVDSEPAWKAWKQGCILKS